ncbi:MAG: vWA domain-containing protein [Candidatus Gastranaerophilaceae bacterium]
MKRVLLFLLLMIAIPAFADNYSLHKNGEVSPDMLDGSDERILFILDFSNSMTEYLDGERKVDLMMSTIKSILPNINKNTSVGMRVYGHRMGFTPYEACHASSLISPIAINNTASILGSLSSVKPRGMTPITYSLKQALKYDFMGYAGKKHIILLTDGGENCDESPCSFVMELIKVRKDVKIDVIAFNINDEDDLEQLECTSLVTSGKFYSANTAAELARSLNNSLNMKKEVQARIVPNY